MCVYAPFLTVRLARGSTQGTGPTWGPWRRPRTPRARSSPPDPPWSRPVPELRAPTPCTTPGGWILVGREGEIEAVPVKGVAINEWDIVHQRDMGPHRPDAPGPRRGDPGPPRHVERREGGETRGCKRDKWRRRGAAGAGGGRRKGGTTSSRKRGDDRWGGGQAGQVLLPPRPGQQRWGRGGAGGVQKGGRSPANKILPFYINKFLRSCWI
ncbi:hypothetical protein Pcinc_042987 [Petrolisthes cinctipes]|uniref:Uncharacterized protein n=1 Tax=Petrolisthes cinctipes TaxID=88211 RepID=A0AAE1EGH9_PETCI|nr:hypothetical protein Pcinc_042987 [Petrolisthes cinctipes]